MSEKTEEPTPQRLRRALEDGDSGASVAAAQAVAFLVAIVLAPRVFDDLARYAQSALVRALTHLDPTLPNAGGLARNIAVPVVTLVVPLLFAVALVAGVLTAAQTGGMVAMKRLAPKLERLNPFSGLANLFSAQRAFTALRAVVAALFVIWLAWRELAHRAPDFVSLVGRPQGVATVAATVAYGIAKWTVVVMLALGATDLVTTRRAWLKRLRMSPDEVKREHREAEGDPELKAARKRSHQEMLTAATVLGVKGASVVIVNPTHLACALRYDENDGDAAPVVVASGEGDTAAEIIKAARDYGIPVVRDVPLARALRELELGTAIPEALYEAVAEVLREIIEQTEKT